MLSLLLLPLLLTTGYMQPDSAITTIVDTPLPPWITISPDSSIWLVRTVLRNPPISHLAMEELRLAGVRFNPATNAPSRTTTFVKVSLMRAPEGKMLPLTGMPSDPRIKSFAWSPDGSMAAFTHETSQGIELWLLTTREASARRLTGPIISLVAEAYPQWHSGGDGILCAVVPEGRAAPPTPDPVPQGPMIQEASGVPSPVRTLQDLLRSPHDEALFEHYLTASVALVRLDGTLESVVDPCMVTDLSPSPDGRFILVTTVERPFSNAVTADRFPGRTQVWDSSGAVVYDVERHGVLDRIPITRGSVQQGRRAVAWREDADAMLCWVEALDGGDAGAESDLRDRVSTLAAPFEGDPLVLAELTNRFSGIAWSSDTLAIISEWWWPSRNIRSFRVRPGGTDAEKELLLDYSWEDSYNDPGTLLTTTDHRGREVIYTAKDAVFFRGDGATPEGERPFVDRFDLETKERTRLFQSSPPHFESPARFLDRQATLLLLRRESASENPNYYIRDLTCGSETKVTDFPHPYPWFQGMHKEIITYTRSDGLPLSATLYLPPGYRRENGPLPMAMWAYPREFVSADAAGQVSGSPHRFDYIGWWSPLIWLLQGFAVLDDPAMPIVSRNGELPNESFVEQLSQSAEAAVKAVVEMGVADRERIAIGGHSYGAFMTASLLAHTDLFAAGLARTGAYNRTLTPFGFQSEDRNLWAAKDTYIEMSPFMYADQIHEPLLLIHGEADQNPGTFPMQSERLFSALNGLGGIARLVMLPLEDHSYRARESILHVLWETQEWLDRHVKHRGE